MHIFHKAHIIFRAACCAAQGKQWKRKKYTAWYIVVFVWNADERLRIDAHLHTISSIAILCALYSFHLEKFVNYTIATAMAWWAMAVAAMLFFV